MSRDSTPTARTLLALLLFAIWLAGARSEAADQCILVYQRNGKGFVHDNLAASAQALREVAAELKIACDVSTNAAVFSDDNLRRYHAIVFANSNNEAFESDAQRHAFQRYLQGGGAFMGIHSSTGSERQWPWFQQLQGAKFLRHPPLQKFAIRVSEPRHPSTAHLPAEWLWTDECYFFTNVNPNVRVLLALDPATLRDPKLSSEPGQQVRGQHALAWCHESEGGRRFYTSLGHKIEHYSDPQYRKHLRGALEWLLAANDPP